MQWDVHHKKAPLRCDVFSLRCALSLRKTHCDVGHDAGSIASAMPRFGELSGRGNRQRRKRPESSQIFLRDSEGFGKIVREMSKSDFVCGVLKILLKT